MKKDHRYFSEDAGQPHINSSTLHITEKEYVACSSDSEKICSETLLYQKAFQHGMYT